MKNKLYQALLLIFLVAGISSCDYLDIVPDERPTEEDAFKDKFLLCFYAQRTRGVLSISRR